MKKLRAYGVMIVSLLGVAAACTGSVIFARTVFVEYSTVRAMQEERAQLTTRDSYVGSMRILSRDTETQRMALAQLTERSDPAELIQEVESVGEQAGVNLSTESVSTNEITFIEGSPKAPVISLVMRATGSFRSVIHFLELLEESPVPTLIEQVSLEQDGSGDFWTMSVRLSIVAFEQ